MSKTQMRWTSAIFMITFVIAVVVLNKIVRDDHQRFYEQKISLIGALRKSTLEAYLETVQGELGFWVNSDLLETVSRELDSAWDNLPGDPRVYLQGQYAEGNPHLRAERWRLLDSNDDTPYSKAHYQVHELAQEFISVRGYQDFLLIDTQGNIIYTVNKKDDFGENLNTGQLQSSGLAKIYKSALADKTNSTHFTDFSRYQANDNQPTVFIARRMHDEQGRANGVVAIALDTSSIMEIMQAKEGMGESGETYLVGQDYLMRSDSRFSKESTALITKVNTITVNKALNGEQGVELTPDYRDVPVLSAYDYLDIGSFRWALMSEIDKSEVQHTNPVSALSIAVTGLFTYLLGLFAMLFIGRFDTPADGLGMEDLEF